MKTKNQNRNREFKTRLIFRNRFYARIYNKFYSKTNSRRIASLAAKITNIISHSKWNKEQIYSLEEELPANVIPFAKKENRKSKKQ
jgi:hypothetical protein